MRELTLSTDEIALVVLPEHGGDLHSLTHRPTGVDVCKPYWSTASDPWGGQATAMAIEPVTTYPGHGLNYVNENGGSGLIIPAGDTVRARMELTVFVPPTGFTEVVDVEWGGDVSCRCA